MENYIAQRLQELHNSLPKHVELVAVSKYYPIEDVATAYRAGQRVFGESRAQELCEKYQALPKDIQWHFIGHLQPNKVKYIAPFIKLIHAVDSMKLLREIDKQGRKYQRVIPCLLQLHVAQEETKYGFSLQACRDMLQEGEWRELSYAPICGIMCMASHTDDVERIRDDFRTAHGFYEEVRETYFHDNLDFRYCSWGMSSDYTIAVDEGANLVRIGSSIFECP